MNFPRMWSIGDRMRGRQGGVLNDNPQNIQEKEEKAGGTIVTFHDL